MPGLYMGQGPYQVAASKPEEGLETGKSMINIRITKPRPHPKRQPPCGSNVTLSHKNRNVKESGNLTQICIRKAI